MCVCGGGEGVRTLCSQHPDFTQWQASIWLHVLALLKAMVISSEVRLFHTAWDLLLIDLLVSIYSGSAIIPCSLPSVILVKPLGHILQSFEWHLPTSITVKELERSHNFYLKLFSDIPELSQSEWQKFIFPVASLPISCSKLLFVLGYKIGYNDW